MPIIPSCRPFLHLAEDSNWGSSPCRMEKMEFKKEILTAGMKKHLAVMEDFRLRIKDVLTTDGNVNEEEYDSQVQVQKEQTAAEVSLLSDQLEFAEHELTELRHLEWRINEKHDSIRLGSVVVTDKAIFFVSASLEQFAAGDKMILGLSVSSPLYKSMRGKKAGETFHHGNVVYRITDVF